MKLSVKGDLHGQRRKTIGLVVNVIPILAHGPMLGSR